ncbi:MAG: hypothetical protein PF440_11915 [Thiomicrorhabdus sp.]|nr:hypothetical protein [Thiomicrorhabdus sp.]
MNKDPEKEPQGRDINKESNSTTLKQCGWCKYAFGSHRYNYCISGSCSLRKSYGSEVKWSDKCFFLDASKKDIEAIVKNHKCRIKASKSSIRSREEHIRTLKVLSKDAVNRPTLPDDRKHDHFNIDDAVCVYFENSWHFGFVCNGYRHQHGCVSYVLDGRDGTLGCGMSVPVVLLRTEYDFFKENLDEYKIWCSIAYNKEFNGNKLDVAIILAEGGDTK